MLFSNFPIDIRPSWRFLALCVTLLMSACGGGSNNTSSTPNQPTPPLPAQLGKVFALTDVGDLTATLDGYAALATVDGLAFRTAWKVLEPQNGVYNWSTLDTAFDTVRARGKQLTLHIGASSMGLPPWLFGLGVATYTYTPPGGLPVTEPIPWDATFISRYTQFVTALAAHIQARGDASLLYAVSDGVPVAEMSIVGCQNGALNGGILYNRTSYLNAWKATIDAYAVAPAFAASNLFICFVGGIGG